MLLLATHFHSWAMNHGFRLHLYFIFQLNQISFFSVKLPILGYQRNFYSHNSKWIHIHYGTFLQYQIARRSVCSAQRGRCKLYSSNLLVCNTLSLWGIVKGNALCIPTSLKWNKLRHTESKMPCIITRGTKRDSLEWHEKWFTDFSVLALWIDTFTLTPVHWCCFLGNTFNDNSD